MKPHKHCELIKAWADGHELQQFVVDVWLDVKHPCFNEDTEYRIKPRTVKREEDIQSALLEIQAIIQRIINVHP